MGGMLLCDRCRKTIFSSARTINDRDATHLNGTYCSICYCLILTELRACLRKAYAPRVEVNEIWPRHRLRRLSHLKSPNAKCHPQT
jgi:hypothetical protein